MRYFDVVRYFTLLALCCVASIALAGCGQKTPSLDDIAEIESVPPGELGWRYDIASSVTAFIVDNAMYPPAAADSTVFVAALDGKVYALTASSGELLWSYDTGSQAVKRPTVVDGVVYVNTEDGLHALDAETGDGLWLHSSSEVAPTVVDGTVFSVRNAGDVVALDAASGETVWGYGNGNGLMRHSLTVSGGMVYFGIDYDHLYASNASNGQMEWSHKINTTMYASPVVADGAVYAITFDGDLNALDASSGELLWHDQIPGNVSRLLEVVDGGLYVAPGDLHALDASTGDWLWSLPEESFGGVYWDSWGVSARAVPYFAMAEGVVYIGSNLGGVFALDAGTGEQIWHCQTASGEPAAPTPLGGVVYTGSLDGGVYALDAATGEWLWLYATDYSVLAAPIAVDDVIVVASWDGSVYELRDPGAP